jgi:hypothetical protein
MQKVKVLWILGALLVTAGIMNGQLPAIGGRLVFVSNRDGNENLWVMDLPSLEVKRITNFPEDRKIVEINQPSWSKDGKKVLFTGWDGLYPIAHNFYMVGLNNLQVIKLTEFQTNLGYTSRWDPINPDVLYYQECQGWGIEVFHRLNVITLHDDRIPSSNPSYSSGSLGWDITTDGQEILYNRDQSYRYSFVGYQDMLGNDLGTIYPYSPARLDCLKINRKDDWILFIEGTTFPGSVPCNICKMDKTGNPSPYIQLTSGLGGEINTSPCWADGDNTGYIFFCGNKTGDYEICLMKAEPLSYPGGLINLTMNPAQDKYPDWTPTEWCLDIQIDIKPGSSPNSIFLGSNGNVPVAILSTPSFDATQVDPLSVTLAGARVLLRGKGTPMASQADINEDGLMDLVAHVDTTALQLTVGDTEAVLEGMTFAGLRIRGRDTVRIIGLLKKRITSSKQLTLI